MPDTVAGVAPLIAEVRALPVSYFVTSEVASGLGCSKSMIRRLAHRHADLVQVRRRQVRGVEIDLYDLAAVEALEKLVNDRRAARDGGRGRPTLWRAAVVDINSAQYLVVGICTPWRPGKPPLPKPAVPEATAGKDEWSAVLTRLKAALLILRGQYPRLPLIVAGDFNQSLGGALCTGSRAGEAAADGRE